MAEPICRCPKTIMLRILFLIYGMDTGGAQRQLFALTAGLQHRGHSCSVLLWKHAEEAEERFHSAGVNVIRIRGDNGRWRGLPGLLYRIAKVAKKLQPDVIHGYLTTGNLGASVAGLAVPKARIVWSVRSTAIRLSDYDGTTILMNLLCNLFARSTDLIIANSQAGARDAIRCGYPSARMKVIPNGIDTLAFHPAPIDRARLRKDWGASDEDRIVGILARLDPMKGYCDLLAAAKLMAHRPDVRFVAAGEGYEPFRGRLLRDIRQSGLGDRFLWIGECNEPSAFWSAVDLACSCSLYGEGFSNAIAEAMACGTPCVVTDVGDARTIVGPLGTVVPPGDPHALAVAIDAALTILSPNRGRSCRERIKESFSTKQLFARTEAELTSLMVAPPASQGFLSLWRSLQRAGQR